LTDEELDEASNALGVFRNGEMNRSDVK